ncbi:MAG TPA: formylglycine-generating enzyme family protein [Candidatus Paceibacterota bacterium]|nr:formylglycine-generating enzyme family protein [Verrucomicrobiota bacterium]HRY51276.1 formylglycine-generating enzyme family protein [Candidatus Paceibacterota bacterium]HSA00575.1 formylglycine-generating enzyme family protein [Candidatus Paceibacterota bacterium]
MMNRTKQLTTTVLTLVVLEIPVMETALGTVPLFDNSFNPHGLTRAYDRPEVSGSNTIGVATGQESVSESNPTNRQSDLVLQSLVVTATHRQLTFTTESNWVYRVDGSEDLKTWQALQSDIKGDGQPKVITDVGVSNQRYYRAVMTALTQPPPEMTGMVWIQPGTFTMGSPPTEGGSKDERPQTVVTLTQGFWMGKCEVTQLEYEALMKVNPSSWKGDTLPVECVNWQDAREYCARLTENQRTMGQLPTGYAYRLPTEAEWEYACRAGTISRFSHGEEESQLNLYAWYLTNSESKTHPVGTKLANPWGLHDMHGNVWEWCQDWYGVYPGGQVTDPKGSPTGSLRMIRGGGWYLDAKRCRSAYRFFVSPDIQVYSLGFRVILAPSP